MSSDAYFWPDDWAEIKSIFTNHKETTKMKTFQGILLQPKMYLGLATPYQIFLLYLGGYMYKKF